LLEQVIEIRYSKWIGLLTAITQKSL